MPSEIVLALETLLGLLILIAIITGIFTALFYIKRYLENFAKKTKTKLDDYLVTIVKWPFFTTTLLFSLGLSLAYIKSIFPALLPLSIEVHIDTILSIGTIVFVATVISIIINVIINQRVRKIIEGEPDKETILLVVEKILTYAIYIISSLVALSILFPPTIPALLSLLTGAGFLAIVVGLAAQKALGNFISSLMIIISRPFRVGDRVLFRGDFGFIEEIGFRHTIIRTWDNRRLIIPNSVFDDEVITNLIIKDPSMIGTIMVDISYESDMDLAKKIMVDLAKNHPKVTKDMEPAVHLIDFGESGVKLRLIFKVAHHADLWDTTVQLREQIKKEFDKFGIEIPYPRRQVIFTSEEEYKSKRSKKVEGS
ncbi:Small-conductance mechanosensitive channel [archaeon HR06]|nr:Small-conductance mechanosensitive channel [archaeon HR06]